jgi:hypothetical protein
MSLIMTASPRSRTAADAYYSAFMSGPLAIAFAPNQAVGLVRAATFS